VYGPGHHFPAPDIEDEIEIVERASNRRAQIGDVPGKDLLGSGGTVRVGAASGLWRTAAMTMGEELLLAQCPVHGALGGKVPALVGKTYDDLMGRQVAMLGRGHHLDQTPAF